VIAGVDARIVQTLNGWFAGSSLRADLARTLAIAPLLAIVCLLAFAWGSRRSASPDRRSYLVVGVLGALAALLLNVGLGHFYFRPRPFLELNVRALLPKPADSSLFSDHAAIAASLTAGLVLAHRRIGVAAVGLLVLVGVGRVGVAVQYPTDVPAVHPAEAVAPLYAALAHADNAPEVSRAAVAHVSRSQCGTDASRSL